jgi:hypothetical protein
VLAPTGCLSLRLRTANQSAAVVLELSVRLWPRNDRLLLAGPRITTSLRQRLPYALRGGRAAHVGELRGYGEVTCESTLAKQSLDDVRGYLASSAGSVAVRLSAERSSDPGHAG